MATLNGLYLKLRATAPAIPPAQDSAAAGAGGAEAPDAASMEVDNDEILAHLTGSKELEAALGLAFGGVESDAAEVKEANGKRRQAVLQEVAGLVAKRIRIAARPVSDRSSLG